MSSRSSLRSLSRADNTNLPVGQQEVVAAVFGPISAEWNALGHCIEPAAVLAGASRMNLCVRKDLAPGTHQAVARAQLAAKPGHEHLGASGLQADLVWLGGIDEFWKADDHHIFILTSGVAWRSRRLARLILNATSTSDSNPLVGSSSFLFLLNARPHHTLGASKSNCVCRTAIFMARFYTLRSPPCHAL
jgi:hypothetical protein